MKHGIYYAFWESEWEADYFRYIDKAARLGFDILEIAAGSLPDYSPEKLKDLRKAAEANNIELTVGYGPKPEQNLASPDADVRKTLRPFSQSFLAKWNCWAPGLLAAACTHIGRWITHSLLISKKTGSTAWRA